MAQFADLLALYNDDNRTRHVYYRQIRLNQEHFSTDPSSCLRSSVCEIQPQRGCGMRVAGSEEAHQSERNPVGVGTGGGLVSRGSPAFAGQPRAEGQNAVGVPARPRTSQLSDESFSTPATNNLTRKLCPERTSRTNHVVRLSTMRRRERRAPKVTAYRRVQTISGITEVHEGSEEGEGARLGSSPRSLSSENFPLDVFSASFAFFA